MSQSPLTLPPVLPCQPQFNYPNNKLYQNEVYPVSLSLSFVVDKTHPNGLGISELTGAGIANVFMNSDPVEVEVDSVFADGDTSIVLSDTSQVYAGMTVTDDTTPGNIDSGTLVLSVDYSTNTIILSKPTLGDSAVSPGDDLDLQFSAAGGVGNYGIQSPNPDAGLIVIQLQNNFQKLLGLSTMLQPAITGADVSVTAGDADLVVGQPYQITVIGTTTTAQWHALGLPPGLTPTVGQNFIALSTGVGAGTGKVKVYGVASCVAIQPLGRSPDLQMANLYQNGGAQIIMQTLFPTIDTGTLKSPLIKSALEDGTLIKMQLLLSNSSVTVSGQ